MQTTDLYEAFRAPSRKFSPVPIWWWSGEKLDPARLRWQLERFAEGGVYNLIVLNLAPTSPLYGADADDPPFFSQDWWRIFEGVCEDARRLGVYLWFYDQIGFSGANLQGELVKSHPEYAGQALERVSEVASGPGVLRPPAGGTAIAASAMPVDADGNPRGEPSPLPLEGDGSVRWDGLDSDRRVSLYYAVDRGFDYFSAEACNLLLRTVHGEFEARVGRYFGDVIVGSFQDELPAMPAWSRTFAGEFERRRGYSLLPKLAALWDEYGPEAQRVRRDYQATRADLAEEAFFKPLYNWHEERGLLCGFDQQHPARAGYPIQAVGLYADYQRTHRWFQAPGSDHHGEAKIHSSLAHLYGRPRVWIESFHSSGWGGTLEETFDWLLPWLRAGANLYDPHAVYYSTRGGWWEWAPPSTDWRQPYWKHYPHFARAVSRLCSALTSGRHVCNVGVLYPSSTVQSGLLHDGPTAPARAAHDAYLSLVGSMIWYNVRPGVMDSAHTDYDVLDDGSVQRGEVRDGALHTGGESYKAVILPGCSVLEASTAARLVEFVQGGGTLVAVGARPDSSAGMGSDDASVRALAALFAEGRALAVSSPDELLPVLAGLPAPVEAPVPTLVRRAGGSTLVFVPATFPRATRMGNERDGGVGFSWLDIGYDFDPARYSRRMSIRVRGMRGAPELWEPYSGERRVLECTQTDDGVEVSVPFEDGPGALLVWPDEPARGSEGAPAVEAGDTPVAEQPLAGTWRIELEPTLDNRWGDFALPAGGDPLPVERWRFRHRAEEETTGSDSWADPDLDDSGWEEIHATFGPRGLWTGPALPDTLPPPAAGAADWYAGAEWQEAEYSLSRGIRKDALHRTTLGPKGHVPEEFLDFGRVPAGHAVQFRTVISADTSLAAHLALGAPASKRVWINGDELPIASGGYLALVPVTLREGANILEFRLLTEEDVWLRAHYAFVRDPDRYARPEWIAPADESAKDSLVTFRKELVLPFVPARALVQVGANAPCRLRVNGAEVGVQGGFDPYFERHVARLQPYDVTAHVHQGPNEVELELSDLGRPVALLVDARFESGPEGETLTLSSGTGWEIRRDGQPRELRLLRPQHGEGDPSHAHLWRRPHPLPGASWIEDDAADGTVIPLLPDGHAGRTRVEWVRFLVAPGAATMHLQTYGAVTVYVDGEPVAPRDVKHGDGGYADLTLDLPDPASLRRVCALRVETVPGREGGGIFAGPVRYETVEGAMRAGDWEAQGLAGYSGGVRYKQTLDWTPDPSARRVLLDLGRVRGTAEIFLNGESRGVRVLSPYVYDVGDHLRPGANVLEVRVYNTLGPYLDAVSPTRMVFPGQTESGLMGPVRLLQLR